MPRKRSHVRRVCFVTGTRAEFGLMESTLRAIASHPKLDLQIVATGMHLDRRHGRTLESISHKIDAQVPWRAGMSTPIEVTRATGGAITKLAETFERLKIDIVLIVGDRVEAFAAASAGHLSGKIVSHIHGGDRALGQIDDSLRHAITKLAHVHFAATKQSAARIAKLGENKRRIHTVGAPGIDGIARRATPSPSTLGRGEGFALLLLHPIDADDTLEYRRANRILTSVRSLIPNVTIIHPNNDPGSRGIARCWNAHARDPGITIHRSIDRPRFLGLLRDAAVLVGNSSSGIIEAASFGTPVIDVGPRQLGRERSENVTNVPYGKAPLLKALRSVWRGGHPKRFLRRNVYGGNGAGQRIANVLSSLPSPHSLTRKLIAY